jgi:cytidylate kinase
VSARIITISATFGAGGSVIGPAVAEHLGLPFVDRAIPAAVAAEIGCSLEEALAHDDRAERGIGRILAGAARLPNVTLGGMDVYLPDRALVPDEEFVSRTEKVLKGIAEGIILGRAGAVVLAGQPDTLHVRIDGPRKRRLAHVAASFGVEEREAERMLDDNDRARAAYVKHFYRVDPADPDLYHLVLDGTSLSEAACTDLVVCAAKAV